MSDAATLAALHPAHPFVPQWRSFRNSPRPQGSHFLKLQRVTKLPDSSRPYTQGDPVRMIDWKAFARTEQLMVRQIRDEASARVRIFVDLSPSMHWPSHEVMEQAGKIVAPKSEIAFRIALHLAYAHLRQGDIVKVELLEEGARATQEYTPRSTSDILAQFDRLVKCGFAKERLTEEFQICDEDHSQVEVAYWVGDCLSQLQPWEFLGRGGIRFLLHTLSQLETKVDWLEPSKCYFDEGRQLKEFQGAQLLSAHRYRRGFEKWVRRLKRESKSNAAAYCQLNNSSLVQVLHQSLEIA